MYLATSRSGSAVELQAKRLCHDLRRDACIRTGRENLMRTSAYLVTIALVATIACGKTATSPSASPSTLNIILKDTPFADAKSLLVTFSTVSAHMAGGDFVTLPFSAGATSRTCDLKKLTTATDVLGTGTLTAGHYTQLRLVVSSATLYFDNASTGTACAPTMTAPSGQNAPVTIPSGEVILNREFDVTSSGATTITLDFDGDQSVKALGNGQYMMTPVITVVSVQ